MVYYIPYILQFCTEPVHNYFNLQALINISTGCEQRIHHDCTANALTNYAWWNDRNGNKIEYWYGDYDLTKKGCPCSEDKSCDRNV